MTGVSVKADIHTQSPVLIKVLLLIKKKNTHKNIAQYIFPSLSSQSVQAAMHNETAGFTLKQININITRKFFNYTCLSSDLLM